MTFWILFWKLTFIVTITVFAGMAVWVTIGGWQDLKALLKDLGKK